MQETEDTLPEIIQREVLSDDDSDLDDPVGLTNNLDQSVNIMPHIKGQNKRSIASLDNHDILDNDELDTSKAEYESIIDKIMTVMETDELGKLHWEQFNMLHYDSPVLNLFDLNYNKKLISELKTSIAAVVGNNPSDNILSKSKKHGKFQYKILDTNTINKNIDKETLRTHHIIEEIKNAKKLKKAINSKKLANAFLIQLEKEKTLNVIEVKTKIGFNLAIDGKYFKCKDLHNKRVSYFKKGKDNKFIYWMNDYKKWFISSHIGSYSRFAYLDEDVLFPYLSTKNWVVCDRIKYRNNKDENVVIANILDKFNVYNAKDVNYLYNYKERSMQNTKVEMRNNAFDNVQLISAEGKIRQKQKFKNTCESYKSAFSISYNIMKYHGEDQNIPVCTKHKFLHAIRKRDKLKKIIPRDIRKDLEKSVKEGRELRLTPNYIEQLQQDQNAFADYYKQKQSLSIASVNKIPLKPFRIHPMLSKTH